MADLTHPQRSSLVQTLRDSLGVDVDPEVLTFESSGVTVTISGTDRTITLQSEGGALRTLEGSGFTGRGFTGVMAAAISQAIREMVSETAIAAKKSRGRRAIHGDREFTSR